MAIQIEQRRTLVPGIPIDFRGNEPDEKGDPTGEFVDTELVVPPLNFDALEIMQARLQTLTLQPTVDSMKTLVEALGRALTRNYIGVPRWLITQTIDIANMSDIVVALMDVSGMKRKEFEEKKAAAANPVMDSSGTTSTTS